MSNAVLDDFAAQREDAIAKLQTMRGEYLTKIAGHQEEKARIQTFCEEEGINLQHHLARRRGDQPVAVADLNNKEVTTLVRKFAEECQTGGFTMAELLLHAGKSGIDVGKDSRQVVLKTALQLVKDKAIKTANFQRDGNTVYVWVRKRQ